ncbi:thioredoxin [Candidatus Fermentibacteria bacterium]|nr:thioredoxin [Candidatus Fermentibacteria bacterium]
MKAVPKRIVSVVLVAISAAMIVTGYLAGDPSIILRKAVTICLECIGVG